MGLIPVLVIAAIALPPPLPAPSEFAPRVDNPWFPLRPGTQLWCHSSSACSASTCAR